MLTRCDHAGRSEVAMPFSFVDRYAAEARIVPTLILVLPPILSLLGLYPPARTLTSISIVTMAGAVATIVLSHAVRTRGKAAEKQLFRRWNGPPTTRCLRHRFAESPESVAELHRSVMAATGRHLPTADQEQGDPRAADEEYAAAVEVLRERTRDVERFPVIMAENASYGLRRNLWGIRNWGRTLTTLGALAGLTVVLMPVDTSHGPAVAVMLLNVAALAFWMWGVSERWVQQAAELYAEALFRACGVLRPWS